MAGRTASTAKTIELNPIEFSVVLNRLNSILDEMAAALTRTAFSALLSLTHDFSCCIYDSDARQLAMVDALPIHTSSMHLFLNAIVERFGGDIARGDVFMSNDPYVGNTHVGDLAVASPVCLETEQLLWVAVRAHQLDVGAPVPHSSYAGAVDVWQEGLTIPPVRLYEKGVPRRDVVELYLRNLRWRDLVEGDLMAQLGATSLGVRRLEEFCETYGRDFVLGIVELAIDYASRRSGDELDRMPKGVFFGETWYDEPDESLKDLPIRCQVTIGDELIDVEFVDCAAQVRRGVNASNAVLQAAGGIPVMMMIDSDIPHNHGCLQRIRVSAPAGTICNAIYPASTSLATVLPGDVMQEAVARALAAAMPERAFAGNARWGLIPMLSGRSAETGTTWGHQLLNSGGGGGAAKGADGWPLMATSAAWGGLRSASVEHTESLYPILIEYWEIEPDSMGLGEFIGGPGVRFALRPLQEGVEIIYDSDGLRNPPFGLFGGTPGAGGGAYIEQLSDGSRRFLPHSIYTAIGPKERWASVSTGGGGYGNSLDRPIEMVVSDVRDGLYSRERAREVYGVVMSSEPDLSLDEDDTQRERERLRATQERMGLAQVSPDRAGGSRFAGVAE